MIKARLLLCLFLLFFVGIIVKLFFLQILNEKGYVADYLTTRPVHAERGIIYDRNQSPMAVNQMTYQLFAEPKKLADLPGTISKLKDILRMETASLEARMDPKKDWVRVAINLDKSTRDQINNLNINGLGFDNESDRYYPEASLSAHILGFVGKDDQGDSVGYFGIEGFYDKELAGLPGLIRSERDLVGRPIFAGTQERVDPENGRDLILTIDKAVQNIVKKKMVSAMLQYQAKQGCAIIADPMTMEILSLVCLPDFDPDNYYKFADSSYKNPIISSLYEPGSTFKPLIMAAGIEARAIRPDEEFNEDGPVEISGYKIQTWNNQYGGTTNMTQVLERSSNVGMVYIGNKLGEKKLYDAIKNYGFGSPTGIDLQGETGGYIPPRSDWHPIDYATATFGQGIAVTPMQLITAFSSIVNGGNLMTPYVVKKTVDDQDTFKNKSSHVVRKVLSERTTEILKKMLTDTVEHGEFKWARPKGYTMGGKTGTAQVAIAGHYDPSKTIASFVGFAPVDKPKFIGLVVLDQPKSSIWGAETAAPLFFDIAKDLLVYYNIPPDKVEE